MKQEHKIFKISKYCHCIINKDKKSGLVYHTLFGNGILTSFKLASLLMEQRNRVILPFNYGMPIEITTDLLARRILVPLSFDEENIYKSDKHSDFNIKHLRLCISENCNMNCHYCYVPLKEKETKMSLEVAEKAIREYYKILRKTKTEGHITFFGGEPLLNWDVLKKSIQLIKIIDPHRRYFNHIEVITNGTLIDAEKALFLKRKGVAISISLDGPKVVHDKIRKLKSGKGSYTAITNGIRVMDEMSYKASSFICTISDHNINSLNKIITFAHKKNVLLNINTAFAERRSLVYSVSDDEIVKRLSSAELFANRQKSTIDGTWRWPYNKIFYYGTGICHCMAVGRELSVDSDGSIKPCPGFSEKYGTIFDVENALSSTIYRKFCSRTALNLPECNGCEIQGLCAGGCLLNAYKAYGGDIFRKSESCKLFKLMFRFLTYQYLEKISENV